MKMTERDGKACPCSSPRTDMKKTLQSSLGVMSYVNNTVVKNVNGDLDSISESRKVIANQMNEKYESASTQLSAMAGQITSIANAQHDVAKKLGDETSAKNNTYMNESVPYYYAELDSGKDKLVSTMTDLSNNSSREVSAGKVQGTDMQLYVEDFAVNKMQCAKPVDAAPPKKTCQFSHNLSSTPAEHEIIKGTDLDGNASQSEDSTSAELPPPAAAAAPLHHRSESPIQSEVDSSHESHDDDNASRKSSGSISSLPSPRLKYRDTNTANQQRDVPSNSKPSRRQHRLAVNTSSKGGSRKNKCPSGLPTPTNHQSHKRRKR